MEEEEEKIVKGKGSMAAVGNIFHFHWIEYLWVLGRVRYRANNNLMFRLLGGLPRTAIRYWVEFNFENYAKIFSLLS